MQKHPEILKGEEAKKVIRNYNRVAKVLLEYEILYHQAWMKSVEVAKEGKFDIGSEKSILFQMDVECCVVGCYSIDLDF